MQGGCYCGFIRYETSGAACQETNCHCSICRRISAAAYVTWFSVPKAAFRLLAGEPTKFRSSDVGTRSFCPRCGTPVTFEHTQTPDEIDITTCSLDRPAQLPPKDHTYVDAQLPWVELGDGLPRFGGPRT